MLFTAYKNNQRGTTMLEVLVTIAILAVGLLGLAGLQSRLQVSEMESYQRSQALILLNDMASRITTNRIDAGKYVTLSPVGAGMVCPTSLATQLDRDKNEWCRALQGAAETEGDNSVGAMIGGRGCVESIDATAGKYMITVAWQGLVPISAPPASVSCGSGSYENTATGAACVGDLCRRVVTTIVQIASLL